MKRGINAGALMQLRLKGTGEIYLEKDRGTEI